MKIRNEANRKVIGVIDSRINAIKDMKPQLSRQNGNTIREINMTVALRNCMNTLYEVREEVANSVFEVNIETVSEMIKIKMQNK